jgi:hypothetical protein
LRDTVGTEPVHGSDELGLAEGDAMERTLWLAGGMAIGFILGSRVGRAPYDGLADGARRIRQNQKVRDAVGAARSGASRLYRERIESMGPGGKARADMAEHVTESLMSQAGPLSTDAETEVSTRPNAARS